MDLSLTACHRFLFFSSTDKCMPGRETYDKKGKIASAFPKSCAMQRRRQRGGSE